MSAKFLYLLSAVAAPVVMLSTAPVAVAQAPDAARAPVQTLDDGLLAIMKGAKQLGFAGRADRIGQTVDQAFDIPLMTRLAVGPAWTGFSAADRAALVAGFRKLTVSQYAANFDGYSGEKFIIDPKVETRAGDRLVRTTLVPAKGDKVSLSYRLRQSGGQWRIVDVFYQNAISQIATRRADFSAVVAKGGAKALIAHLNQLSTKAAI